MEVKLLNHTPEPEKTVYLAARQCFSLDFPEEGNKEDWEKLIKFLISHQHFSPFEHVSFTFSIQEISRACSHQLVRHRLASYSQQSQRRVTQDLIFIFPPSIQKEEKTREIYKNTMIQLYNIYHQLCNLGIPKEDARYVLPQAIATNIVVTMNARELFHFFEERLCLKAQWEIRELANKMLQLCLDVSPTIFQYCGAKCGRLKYCPEGKSCYYFPFWQRRKNGM